MKKVLILGAGRSSTSLIRYLLDHSGKEDWQISVGDMDPTVATAKINGHPRGKGFGFNVQDEEERDRTIEEADIVISMVPAGFHQLVAKSCLKAGVNLITASYVPDEMKSLDSELKERGIIFLNECGLDPGIDHMSAMKVIDKIRETGHELRAFETFTGGLIAPGTDVENPWEYKFTWNPRNVVLAGQGVVKFIQHGKYKYIPYRKLFRRTEQIYIPGHGYFEGYANRDSLKYLDIYGLRGIKTIYRGTLRKPGFCRTWDVFVQLGATDDTYMMEGVEQLTHREFINSFLSYNPIDSIELKLAHYLNLDIDGPEMHRLKWAGLFDEEKIGLNQGTPAQILEHILKKKWTLRSEDKDMIVMWHKFEYLEDDCLKEIHSTLVALGDNSANTAMAKTVGLPLGIAAKLILQGRISQKGICIPTHREIYDPILEELSELGFDLSEKTIR